MKYILMGTAGHVDHGKTSLIKVLTGIDTDRLPEEKRRGMSIDLGFAYIDFPEINTRVEIIDIPGHERFIKNAIAGLCSSQTVLLVVDAKEGIKKQTEEHVSIIKALGINHGVCAITKIDTVSKEYLEKTKEDVKKFLEHNELNFKVVPVSSITLEGIEELKEAIKEIATLIDNTEKEKKPLRIFIDSAFVVKGFGTVLRGSCIEGSLKEGEEIIVEPVSEKVKVRKMQNHGVFVKEVRAGERVALNVPDIDRDKVERGFWVLKENTYSLSSRKLVKVYEKVETGKPYFIYFGMREVEGRFRKVNEDVYILLLKEKVVSRRKDRIVILNSEGKPASYGEVLHPNPRTVNKKFIRENFHLLISDFPEYLIKERGYIDNEEYIKLTGEAMEKPENSENAEKVKNKEKRKLNRERILEIEKKLYGSIWEKEEVLREGITREEITECLKENVLHEFGKNLLITDRYLKEIIRELKSLGREFDIKAAKEKLKLSRKFLIPLLEYLDALRYTRREGNRRRWLR